MEGLQCLQSTCTPLQRSRIASAPELHRRNSWRRRRDSCRSRGARFPGWGATPGRRVYTPKFVWTACNLVVHGLRSQVANKVSALRVLMVAAGGDDEHDSVSLTRGYRDVGWAPSQALAPMHWSTRLRAGAMDRARKSLRDTLRRSTLASESEGAEPLLQGADLESGTPPVSPHIVPPTLRRISFGPAAVEDEGEGRQLRGTTPLPQRVGERRAGVGRRAGAPPWRRLARPRCTLPGHCCSTHVQACRFLCPHPKPLPWCCPPDSPQAPRHRPLPTGRRRGTCRASPRADW